MSSENSAVSVVLGAMTFGHPETGVAHVRVTDNNKIKEMIDLFGSYNHTEIDTARVYGRGTSEKVLGDLKAGEKFSISSKQYPYTPEKMGSILNLGPEPWPLTRENIAKHVDIALKSTGVKKLKIFYLHGPDRTTDIEETLKACDEQYKLGKFETLGISNFKSWEVAQACEISRAKGYVQPKVYQGNYSLVQRSVESELESCLRKYNMSFYAFSPLGGGFLTGSVKRDSQAEKGSRFDANHAQGAMFIKRFCSDAYFGALDIIEDIAKKNNLTMAEIALRWISHHSMLKREHGDAIIIGASKIEQLQSNLDDLDKGPLPNDIVEVLNGLWEGCKGSAAPYFH